MTGFTVAVLPGDGIGPEVTREAVGVLQVVGELFDYQIATSEYLVGAAAIRQVGEALPARTAQGVLDSDAVLLLSLIHI